MLQGLPGVRGLVVGPWSEASPDVHALAAEVADRHAEREWRLLGSRSKDEARSRYVTDVRRRWGCTFWREWARLMQARIARLQVPQMAAAAPARHAAPHDGWRPLPRWPDIGALGRHGG